MGVIFCKIFNQSIWLSLSYKEEFDKERSLFLREARAAPTKPIHRVKCWTSTGEATIPVVPNNRVITSTEGKRTNKRKIIIEKLFSILL